MSNAQNENVIRVDTDNYALTSPVNICAIKYIGAANGTANIKADASDSAQILWEESGSANTFNQVEIRARGGIYVNLTNSAVIYIYLE